MISLTFFGGAGEIGGNKILLRYGGAKAYLDFGQSFDFAEDYFYEWLQPRAANGLECYFEFGLMPKMKGLYGKSQLRFTDLEYENPDVDGVFFSHHHSDHIGHAAFLDESIPVHLGHGTKAIIDAYAMLYKGMIEFGIHKDIRTFKSGDRLPVKDLVFRPVHVEHSTPGAYGYVIEGPDGVVAYSGDFRRHGPKRELTDEFIAAAAAAKPRILLCEGTRMSPDAENYYDEEQVYEKVKGIMERSAGLVLGEFSMCNVDRFDSFYRAARESGRILVVDTKHAYLLDRLREFMTLPDPRTDPGLKVYYRLAKTGEFAPRDYLAYERDFLDNKITYKEIREDQRRFVFFTGFNKLMELVYIQPKNADYIFSSSESFLEGEENQDQRQVLDNWLGHFGITLHKAHCSGHAGKSDLEHAVRTINPDILIPIHTHNAEEFKKIHDRVLIVKRGDTVEV